MHRVRREGEDKRMSAHARQPPAHTMTMPLHTFRQRLEESSQRLQYSRYIPPLSLCTDNAVMGAIAIERLRAGKTEDLSLDIFSGPERAAQRQPQAQ